MRKDWRGAGDTILRVDGGMAASNFTMQALADILAPEQADKCFWKILETLDNVFAIFDFAGADPAGHFRESRAEAGGVVGDQEALDLRAGYDQLSQQSGTHLSFGVVVLRNLAAN